MKVRFKKVLALIVTTAMLISTLGAISIESAYAVSEFGFGPGFAASSNTPGLDPAFAATDLPVQARGIGNLHDHQVLVPGQPNPGSDWLNPEWRPVGIGGGGASFDPTFSPHVAELWFFVCDMGGTYRSIDAGRTWGMLNFGGTNTGGGGARAASGDGRAFNFCPTNSNIVYAAMANAGLWKSVDYGTNWVRIFPHYTRSARAHRGDHSDIWFQAIECSIPGCDHRVGGRTMANPGIEPTAFASATLGGILGPYYANIYSPDIFGADGCMAQNWVGYPRCLPPDNFPYGGRVTNLAVNPANPDEIYIIVRQAQGQNAGAFTRDHLFFSSNRGQSFDLIARDVTTRIDSQVLHAWPFVDAVFNMRTLVRPIKDILVDPHTGDLLVFTPQHMQRFTNEGVRSTFTVERTLPPPDTDFDASPVSGNVTSATQADFLWFPDENRIVYFMVNGGFIYRSDDNLATAWRLNRGNITLPGNTNPTTGTQRVDRIGISNENVIWYQGGIAQGGASDGCSVFRSTDGGQTWSHVWRAFGGSGRANTALDPSRWAGFGHPDVNWQEYAVGLGANWSGNLANFSASKACPNMAADGSWGYITATVNAGELWRAVNSQIIHGYDDRGQRIDTFVTTGANVTTSYGVHFSPHNPMNVFLSMTDIGPFQSWDGGFSWRHSGLHGMLPTSGFDDTPSGGRVNSEINWPDAHRRSIGWGTGASGSYADWRNTMYWMAFDPVDPLKLYGVFSGVHDTARLRFSPPRHLAARTGQGGVAVSTDGGRTWNQMRGRGIPATTIPTHIEVGNVTAQGTTLFISTHGQGFFKSYDSGQSWQQINNGVNPVQHHYAQNQTTDGRRTPGSPPAAGADPGLGEPLANWPWEAERSLFGWRIIWVPDETIPYGGVLYGLIARSGSEFVGEASGQLYRSFDGGHNWEAVPMPQNTHIGAPHPVNYVSDLVFDPRNPSTIFAAAWQSTNGDPNVLMAHPHQRLPNSGGVFVSHDRGNTWSQIWLGGENRRVYGIQIDPFNPNNLFVVTFNGEVMVFQYEGPSASLYTGVGYNVNYWRVHQETGMSFRQASEPFIDMNHPDFVFVTGFGGNIWRGPSNVTPRLGGITINGSPLTEFDVNTKTYNVSVRGDNITVEAFGVYHTAVVNGTGTFDSANPVITITVVNEIGTLSTTYTLNVIYNDPNALIRYSLEADGVENLVATTHILAVFDGPVGPLDVYNIVGFDDGGTGATVVDFTRVADPDINVQFLRDIYTLFPGAAAPATYATVESWLNTPQNPPASGNWNAWGNAEFGWRIDTGTGIDGRTGTAAGSLNVRNDNNEPLALNGNPWTDYRHFRIRLEETYTATPGNIYELRFNVPGWDMTQAALFFMGRPGFTLGGIDAVIGAPTLSNLPVTPCAYVVALSQPRRQQNMDVGQYAHYTVVYFGEVRPVYKLELSGITEPGNVSFAIDAPFVDPQVRTVEVFARAAAEFTAVADGTADTVTTSMLTLTFDRSITGLTAAHIHIDGGTTGAVAGALAEVAPYDGTTFELALSGITRAGNITVTVDKPGVMPTGVVVPVNARLITFTVAANGVANTVTTTALTLTFSDSVSGITAADITVGAGATGAVAGALTEIAPNDGTTFELALSGITRAGNVSVAVDWPFVDTEAYVVAVHAFRPDTGIIFEDHVIEIGPDTTSYILRFDFPLMPDADGIITYTFQYIPRGTTTGESRMFVLPVGFEDVMETSLAMGALGNATTTPGTGLMGESPTYYRFRSFSYPAGAPQRFDFSGGWSRHPAGTDGFRPELPAAPGSLVSDRMYDVTVIINTNVNPFTYVTGAPYSPQTVILTDTVTGEVISTIRSGFRNLINNGVGNGTTRVKGQDLFVDGIDLIVIHRTSNKQSTFIMPVPVASPYVTFNLHPDDRLHPSERYSTHAVEYDPPFFNEFTFNVTFHDWTATSSAAKFFLLPADADKSTVPAYDVPGNSPTDNYDQWLRTNAPVYFGIYRNATNNRFAFGNNAVAFTMVDGHVPTLGINYEITIHNFTATHYTVTIRVNGEIVGFGTDAYRGNVNFRTLHTAGIGEFIANGAWQNGVTAIVTAPAFATPADPSVDKDALAALIAEAEALNEGNFTAESWATLLTALSNAIAVYEDPVATQAQVDAAAQALQDAIDALEKLLPTFSWNIFNNGPGGTQYPRPNAGLAEAGLIRMWTLLDGVGAPVYLAAAETIVALDQDENCAMEFIRVGRVWVAGEGWQDYFNLLDINKNGNWQQIDLYITVFGQTVHALLVNTNYVPAEEYHTVTFVIEAGAVGVYAETTITVEVPDGETIPADAIPSVVARPGFYFIEWYPSDPADVVVTEDMTFTARFNLLWHYVTFEAGDGGELVAADGFGLVVRIRDGFTFWADRVPTPVADYGYEFVMWYPVDPADVVVRENMTFTAVFAEAAPVVPQIISVTPNPAVAEQGGTVEITVITQGMPDGAWVDLNVAWRPGLSVVGGPRFYITDNKAVITIAAATDARLGRDGFSVTARAAGDWGIPFIIDSYTFVVEVK